jgi:hypothetical protein
MCNKYAHRISSLEHRHDDAPPLNDFLIWRNEARRLACYYAPFEYTNREARLVLVGITPGGTQMNRALNAAREALRCGVKVDDAVRAVKKAGSFSGAMRPNIINTLDRLGYHKELGLDSTRRLWESRDDLVHFCSLLKFPVFVGAKDYNGNPHPLTVRELSGLIEDHLVQDLASINAEAELVPLGDTVADVIEALIKRNLIRQQIRRFEGKVVSPPHPSGANAESISLLLASELPALASYQDQM